MGRSPINRKTLQHPETEVQKEHPAKPTHWTQSQSKEWKQKHYGAKPHQPKDPAWLGWSQLNHQVNLEILVVSEIHQVNLEILVISENVSLEIFGDFGESPS